MYQIQSQYILIIINIPEPRKTKLYFIRMDLTYVLHDCL